MTGPRPEVRVTRARALRALLVAAAAAVAAVGLCCPGDLLAHLPSSRQPHARSSVEALALLAALATAVVASMLLALAQLLASTACMHEELRLRLLSLEGQLARWAPGDPPLRAAHPLTLTPPPDADPQAPYGE